MCVSPGQSVVGSVTAEYNREQLWLANEALVTQLQARVRGYLVRRAHAQRLDFLRQQEPHVVRLQVLYCVMFYNDRFMKSNTNVISTVNIHVPLFLFTHKYCKHTWTELVLGLISSCLYIGLLEGL